MLPLIVLRRLDAVLEPTKQAVLEAKKKYEVTLQGEAFEKAIAKVAIAENRQQPLYNLSKYPSSVSLRNQQVIKSRVIHSENKIEID
ncbi:hypothetical protein PCC9214_01209 [Planktothrix tepida]|nr:hypothetical protein PCC9214_01209 [Planktothrix tepida]CAD5979774.1 hypothetical protein NO713_04572 [Planktothrix pseudagardhii]